MKIRRTVSIDKGDLEALKPLLDSSGNNLSLALRKLIDEYRQNTVMSRISSDQQKMIMLRNQIIESRIAALIPVPLVKWLVKRSNGVPPLGTFRIIMEKYTKLIGVNSFTFNDYIRMISVHQDVFGYQIKQHIETSPDLRNIKISFEGEDADHLKGTVINYSSMLAHHPIRLKTRRCVESPNLIIIEYEQCDSEEEAYKSVVDHFGHNQMTFDEVQNNIQFWRNAVNVLKADHYEDVIVSRDIFQKLLKSQEFSEQLSNTISIVYNVSVEDAGYRSITGFIGGVCKTNGLIYRMENSDNEVRIYHTFDDKDIIHTVNETIIKTLAMAGQQFVLKKGDKMTILSRK